jgi:hypothetical protein
MLDTEKEITKLDEKTFEVAEKIAGWFVVEQCCPAGHACITTEMGPKYSTEDPKGLMGVEAQ